MLGWLRKRYPPWESRSEVFKEMLIVAAPFLVSVGVSTALRVLGALDDRQANGLVSFGVIGSMYMGIARERHWRKRRDH